MKSNSKQKIAVKDNSYNYSSGVTSRAKQNKTPGAGQQSEAVMQTIQSNVVLTGLEKEKQLLMNQASLSSYNNFKMDHKQTYKTLINEDNIDDFG